MTLKKIGVKGILKKPVDMNALGELITEHLDLTDILVTK